MGNIKTIFNTHKAFAALDNNGRVQAWGDDSNGGELPDSFDNGNIKMIFSHYKGFAALDNSGKVQAWGYGEADYKQIPPDLSDVKIIFSTYSALGNVQSSNHISGLQLRIGEI